MRKYFTPSRQLPLGFDAFSLPENDPIVELTPKIDFEQYRHLIESVLSRNSKKLVKNSGRRPMDPIFMLRILFLQRFLGQSDQEFEASMLADRRVQYFLSIYRQEDVPSSKTIWKYRERFTQLQIFEMLFDFDLDIIKRSDESIGEKYVAVDSSFLEAPKQRNTRQENQKIKEGHGEALWKNQPRKKSQKDIDARWTKKREEIHYGYKMHTTVCMLSKYITDIYVTAANVHDAPGCIPLIKNLTPYEDMRENIWERQHDPDAPILFADAGYVGPKTLTQILRQGWRAFICAKGSRGKPLSEEEKEMNKAFSSVRSRVEHVFGYIEGKMKGLVTRAIGLERAREIAALTAWVYNRMRTVWFLSKTA